MSGSAQIATKTAPLLYDVVGGIGLITFNRPQARNALTFDMYEGLAKICAQAAHDGALKALIITGAGGRAFAAGTDISLFRDFGSGRDGLAYEQRMERVMVAVETCPVPTIAALSGACTGGGALIAACCDIRIATADLKFGIPIARSLGNCLSARNLLRLKDLLGAGRVKDLMFLARLMGAREALNVGLISEIVGDAPGGDAGGGMVRDDAGGPDTGEAVAAATDADSGLDAERRAPLLLRAYELAGQMATHAPLTLRATKQMLNRMRDGMMDDSDLVDLCYASEDFAQGVEAFLDKRKPQWRGR